MPMPRPLADLYCLLHDLIAVPREVLLARAHHQWVGAGVVALTEFPTLAGRPFPLVPQLVLLAWGGCSWLLDVAGTAAHQLWERGRIWRDLSCSFCGRDDGPGDDDPTDGPEPPPEDHGLTAADEAWLASISHLPTPTTEHERTSPR